MRRLTVLFLVLAMVLPLAIPFGPALAQENGVKARLEEYNANLPKGYGNVSVQDLGVELIENPNVILVDVRETDEYAGGHLPGAFNIPLRELAQHLDALPDLNAEIVVYCGSGFRSAIAMTSLQVLGYTNVRSMKGGIKAWQGEEYTETDEVVAVPMGAAPDIDPALVAAVDAELTGIPAGWGAVKPEDLNAELIDSPVDMLIDVRSQGEWDEQGHIPGAVLMPLESLMSFADQWPSDKAASIVIYCASGHRGNIAATMLRILGYTNVRNLSGGFTAWATAGLPVETTPAAEGALDLVSVLDAYISNLPANFNAIRPNDVAAALVDDPSLLLVDVRTVDEYIGGHLEGAINVPLVELTDHLDMLPNLDQKMIVYCGSGHRSAMAMAVLNLMGYSDAQSMLGGIKAWSAAELPVVTEDTVYEAGTAPAVDPALLAAVDAYVHAIPAGYYTIGADDLNVALIENAPILIDVRTDSEVAGGFIEGAIHIELRTFMSQMDKWPTDKSAPIVVYCGSDHRAVIAMVAMQLMGYENVRSLAGGLQAWLTKEYPVVTE